MWIALKHIVRLENVVKTKRRRQLSLRNRVFDGHCQWGKECIFLIPAKTIKNSLQDIVKLMLLAKRRANSLKTLYRWISITCSSKSNLKQVTARAAPARNEHSTLSTFKKLITHSPRQCCSCAEKASWLKSRSKLLISLTHSPSHHHLSWIMQKRQLKNCAVWLNNWL